MAPRKTVFVMVGLLWFANFGLAADFSQAHSSFADSLSSEQIPWRHLSYQVKNFLGKVTTDVRLEIVPAAEAAKLLIPVPRDCAFQTSGPAVLAITVQSVIDPLFGQNDNLKTRSWYSPQEANVLQRIRLRQGGEIWQKTYRFTPNGVWRVRKQPNDSRETKLPLEQWTDIEESFYSYNMKTLGCSRVLTPIQLLILASAMDIPTEDEPLNLCVFNKKQLHNVQIHTGGSERLKVSYDEMSTEGKVHREELVETAKISFRTHSLVGKDQEPEEFSFLGLKGDFDIYLDADSGLPVLVSGKLSPVGKLDIRLVEVELNK